MNKSEFYLKWYSEEMGEELNSAGYPQCGFLGEDITTAEQWTAFLVNELELDEFKRLDERACEMLGGTWARPHEWSREYPELGLQLDSLFHDIESGKLGEDAKTGTFYTLIKKVKDDTPKN